MTARRDDIIRWLNEFMLIDRFHDSLPIGLQVEGADEVRRVVTGVTACEPVFRHAAETGAEMVLVHHGMFWEKEDRVVRGMLKRRLRALLDSDISLVGYHLPLDAHPEIGNNAMAARGMGLQNVEPFADYHGNLIGFRGTFEPVPVAEFVHRAAAFYGCEPVSAVLGGADTVQSAGVVSGGAWPNIWDAIGDGLDIFVTGTADEPAWHIAREEGIHFLAFGHTATERVGIRTLGERLASQFDLDVEFLDVPNPL